MNKRIITAAGACVIFALPGLLAAHVTPELDLGEHVRNSGFIFRGKVTNVEYRNSELVPLLDATGSPVFEEGNPLYVDGSNLPHTFVTWSVEEIYKGSLPTRDPVLTLRFEGGQSDIPDPCETIPGGDPVYNDYLLVTDVPLFDPNDRDFLFVKGNAENHCPLYNWDRGRFRILDDPNNPTAVNMIYNEYGQQVRLISEPGSDPNGIIFGDVQEITEVLTHTMGQMQLADVYVDAGTEEEDPIVPTLPGVHADESDFGAFIAQVVLDECGTGLPPEDCGVEILSFDPNLPFNGVPFTPREPNDVAEEPETVPDRPWLDNLDPNDLAVILEQERLEDELFTGNPVLPETPCEIQIFNDGRITGDISGPSGVPDCYVDIIDFGALAGVWLECNHPDDPGCSN